jgi:hypothetical protein
VQDGWGGVMRLLRRALLRVKACGGCASATNAGASSAARSVAFSEAGSEAHLGEVTHGNGPPSPGAVAEVATSPRPLPLEERQPSPDSGGSSFSMESDELLDSSTEGASSDDGVVDGALGDLESLDDEDVGHFDVAELAANYTVIHGAAGSVDRVPCPAPKARPRSRREELDAVKWAHVEAFTRSALSRFLDTPLSPPGQEPLGEKVCFHSQLCKRDVGPVARCCELPASLQVFRELHAAHLVYGRPSARSRPLFDTINRLILQFYVRALTGPSMKHSHTARARDIEDLLCRQKRRGGRARAGKWKHCPDWTRRWWRR